MIWNDALYAYCIGRWNESFMKFLWNLETCTVQATTHKKSTKYKSNNFTRKASQLFLAGRASHRPREVHDHLRNYPFNVQWRPLPWLRWSWFCLVRLSFPPFQVITALYTTGNQNCNVPTHYYSLATQWYPFTPQNTLQNCCQHLKMRPIRWVWENDSTCSGLIVRNYPIDIKVVPFWPIGVQSSPPSVKNGSWDNTYLIILWQVTLRCFLFHPRCPLPFTASVRNLGISTNTVTPCVPVFLWVRTGRSSSTWRRHVCFWSLWLATVRIWQGYRTWWTIWHCPETWLGLTSSTWLARDLSSLLESSPGKTSLYP